jgi:hypothetical protein
LLRWVMDEGGVRGGRRESYNWDYDYDLEGIEGGGIRIKIKIRIRIGIRDLGLLPEAADAAGELGAGNRNHETPDTNMKHESRNKRGREHGRDARATSAPPAADFGAGVA